MLRNLGFVPLVVVLLVLALVAPQADARTLSRLFVKTSATAGSLDSGVLGTGLCDTVVATLACDTAACASYTLQFCTSKDAATCYPSGITLAAPGAGAISDGGSLAAPTHPPPAFVRYQATAGAAGVAKLSVYCAYTGG